MGDLSALAERFGKYFVLGQLARTPQAEVYKVKTVGIAGFEKVQVLKRILPPWSRDPTFIRVFLDESRTAVSLNHRCITQVFDFGRIEDELFMTLELVDGIDLRETLVAASRTGAPMPAALGCYLLSEVAAGLDYAHKKVDAQGRPIGVVHCDLSPRNVEVSYEGYVKILDFSLGRALLLAPVEAKRQRGSGPYVAPEQVAGEAPTPAVDVFALGVIACELLTGLPPITTPDVEQIRSAIQPEGRGDDRRDVFEPLAEAISLALAREPESRRSAADLGAAFGRAHRALDPGVGSRTLAKWIAEVLPPPDQPVDSTMPGRRKPKSKPPADTGAHTGTSTAAPTATVTATETALTPGLTPAAARIEEQDSQAEPETLGEKRRIVAAACHVDGGTPERRNEAQRILANIAYKHGAIVNNDERGPDWAVALFGMELAGEDDVAHALRFALDASEAFRDLGLGTRPSPSGERVTLRIGVRQGIVARRRAGRNDYLLLGDALDEARAMALLAAPGKTLLGGGAGRLAAAHYAFRELAPMKRRARRVRVQELLGARTSDDRRRAARPESAFYGREAELVALDTAYDEARRGDRRLFAAIVGEAGIGKSRLVAEYAMRVAASRPILLQLAATPGDRHAPYAMVGDIFAAGLGMPSMRGATGRGRLLERLKQVLRERGVPRDETDATLATVDLALRLRDADAPSRETDTQSLRDRVVAAIATLRGLSASGRPRLTFLEDWHWVDAPSAEVFNVILKGQPAAGGELVVLTARPDDAGNAPPFPPAVSPVIRLGELGPDERSALIRDRLGRGADEGAVALVARRAGGNPLFIEELAQGLSDLGQNDLPESARGVIAARVDRLPPAAKAVLQYAAVIGPVFRARVLEKLLGRSVHGALRLLDERGLVCPAAAPTMADSQDTEGELQFRHGLIQEVVYEAVSGAARRDAHRRIGLLGADAFDQGAAESPGEIARHLELGGEEAKASAFYLRAGRLALAAFDAAAAVGAFTKALDLGAAKDPERAREAIAGREHAYFVLGDHGAQFRDLKVLERMSADDPRRLADVMNRAALRHLRLGEYASAVAATEAAERAAEEGGDERTRGEALRVRAEAFERQAQFDRALDSVSRALEIFRRIGAGTEETRAMIGIGRIHLMCSRYDQALTHYMPALERVKNSGDAWLERILRNNVAVIHLGRGEYTEAYDNAMRAIEICRRIGDRAREGDNCSVAGSILLELGRYDEARDWMQAGLAIHAETGSRWSQADALVYAGTREILTGQLDRGFKDLEESIAIARDIGARYIVANAKNQLAKALIERRGPGDLERADREASEGAELGKELALAGCEIQGLSRAALARLENGDSLGALVPSIQAVSLLDRVRYIEWSEEEILYVHYRVLRQVGDPLALGYLARAYAGLMAKLTRIGNRDWQKSFADDVQLHRRIREEHARASQSGLGRS